MSVIGSFDCTENGWLFFQVLFYDVFMLLRYDEFLIKETCPQTFTSFLYTNHVKKYGLSFNLVTERDIRETGLGYSYSVHVCPKGLSLRSSIAPFISGIFLWFLLVV